MHMFLCISEGNQLSSEMCRWHFSFNLAYEMPDEAVFMSMVLLLCTAVTGGNAKLSRY